jgi:oligoendopeptidase F
MSGVPNTSITEALAFVFQERDLQLLGIRDSNPEQERLETLNSAWSLMEIMGVGMVDMKTWKWMYANPETTPAQLKEAIISIAKETWNTYFAPVFGVKDSPILAIYSHMISNPLYLPNYSYGQIVQFQIEEYLKGKQLSAEIDRMYSQGRLTPQQWMMGATGSKISTKPLLEALEKAL